MRFIYTIGLMVVLTQYVGPPDSWARFGIFTGFFAAWMVCSILDGLARAVLHEAAKELK